MFFQDMTIEEKLDCFSELMSCSGSFFLWTYDRNGELLASSCSMPVLHKIFIASGLMEFLLDYIQENDRTIILSISQGLLWAAAFSHDSSGQVDRIYVYGPVGTQELSSETIVSIVNNSMVSQHWQPKLRKYLSRIPIVMSSVFFQQAILLHYCATNEEIKVADLVFHSSRTGHQPSETKPRQNRIQTYMAEQELLRMVREGNLDYKKALHQATLLSQGVGDQDSNALNHAKTSQIVFISLCTRAAIEGGISPEIAYSKGDTYIQDVQQCMTVSDAVNIGHSMYEDFIRTVHNRNANPLYSPPIQSCCDFIETHLSEKIELDGLARRIGYTEYYLSRKFRKETGMSVNEYIRKARINKAKILLSSTQMSIQEISDSLCFGNRSFFADTFRKMVGVPPAEYRKAHQKL